MTSEQAIERMLIGFSGWDPLRISLATELAVAMCPRPECSSCVVTLLAAELLIEGMLPARLIARAVCMASSSVPVAALLTDWAASTSPAERQLIIDDLRQILDPLGEFRQ